MQRRQRKRLVSEMNVVPYIDVMLVLLVIFMITTPLLTQGVKVTLPKAKAKPLESTKRTPIIVTVDASGQRFLNVATKPNTPLSANALVNQVAAQLQFSQKTGVKRPVLVRGDAKVNYEAVVSTMVLLQQAGASSVGLITTNAKEHA